MIPTDEFSTMCARARSFRRRVDELGTVSSPAIDGYVRDQLYGRRHTPLPPAQAEFADEILALLQMPGLSPQQAHQIMREFFEA
jgi:hypothetical protein